MEKKYFPKGKNRQPHYWKNPKYNQPKQPVVGVDWFDAYAYAKWAHKRLPVGNEWERAARGPQLYLYPWGNKFDPNKLNYSFSKLAKPAPVGSYPSGVSPYGCHDMAGNVWEWTANWFKPYSGNNRNSNYGETHKVIRGGSFSDYCDFLGDIRVLQTTFRMPMKPNIRSYKIGFRCVRDRF